MMCLIKWTLTLFLLMYTFFLPNGYAKPLQPSMETRMLSENEERDLVHYLERVLIEAGVPDDVRNHLIDMSRPQLSKINENDYQAKKELLQKNLYILLIDLASKKPILLNESDLASSTTHFYFASESFLTEKHLSFVRSNRVFAGLKIADVKVIFKSLCPMWPWC